MPIGKMFRRKADGVLMGYNPAWADYDTLELIEVVQAGQDVVAPPPTEPVEEIPDVDAPEGQLGAALPLPEPKPRAPRRRKPAVSRARSRK